jgi:hypothetical protein
VEFSKTIGKLYMSNGNVLINYAQVAHITKFLTNYCYIFFFFEGLLPMDQSTIDAVSGGALAEKTHVEARDLISKMTANSQQFEIRADHTSRKVNEVMHSNIETQHLELTSFMRQVALGQVRQSRVYGIYAFPEHSTDICSQLQEDVTPQV